VRRARSQSSYLELGDRVPYAGLPEQ
jgi:hypothetical protein